MANNNKLHIRKGDTVKVISGGAKGEKGTVLSVNRETSRVIVSEVNLAKKHVKPTTNSPQGEIVEIEASIHISNVMVVDPKSGEASRTGRKLNAKGKSQRFSKKSGNFI